MAHSAHDDDCRCTRCVGFQVGNSIAVKAGDCSEIRLRPVRKALAHELVGAYPWVHPARLTILADRLARLRVAREWLDEQGSIVRDADGNPWPLLDRLSGWETRADATIAELEREREARQDEDGLRRLQEAGRDARRNREAAS